MRSICLRTLMDWQPSAAAVRGYIAQLAELLNIHDLIKYLALDDS